ncbi:type 4b pilus protein PilO2 [Luteimonas sp. MHLX1A]|uniref:type 4b pilus protein PilO2 n=1 Tax=Alterluteimonas muca TaxID=2878684 RepID=UPI001E442C94|nr:type 4b pilus protein PilO2 [Luteimonas sp. MHLX1A]
MTQTAFLSVAGKERLTGGLSWLPLVGEERGAQRTEFRRFLREHKSAYGVLLPSGDQQRYAMAGVAVVGKGMRYKHVAGTPAAAHWFAESVPGRALYVERLDNGLYWALISTGGGLDPRTDRVLRPAALVALADELDRESGPDSPLAIHCWPDLEAMPHELAIMARLHRTPLVELLSLDKRPRLRVSKVIGPPTWFMPTVVAICAVGLTGYLGHGAYVSLQEQREASRLAAERAAAEAAAQLQSRLAEQSEAERKRSSIHDALSSPAPHALIDACTAVVDDLPTSLGGWSLRSASCSAGAELRAKYARESGRGLATHESFSTAASEAGLSYQLDWFGNEASVHAGQLALESRQGDIERLPHTDAAGEAMATHAVRVQSLLKGGQFQVGPAQLPKVEDDNADPGFRIHTVQMAGSGLWMLKRIVPELGHMKLESLDLTRDRASWRWTAVGVLYTSPEQS